MGRVMDLATPNWYYFYCMTLPNKLEPQHCTAVSGLSFPSALVHLSYMLLRAGRASATEQGELSTTLCLPVKKWCHRPANMYRKLGLP